MKLYVNFVYLDEVYSFGLLNSSDSCRLELPDVFVIDVFKVHNHLYTFKAFFYRRKRIISNIECNSKSNLLCVIQDLLQEELSNV